MPRPLRWLIAAALLAAFCYAGLSRISFNVEILKMLPTNLRQVQGLSLFLKHFSQPDELMITVEAADAEIVETAATELAEHLRGQPELVRRAVERAPWEAARPQMAEFLGFALLNQAPDKMTALIDRLSAANIGGTLQQAREKLGESIDPQEIAMLGYDPLGITALLDFKRFAQGSTQSEFSSADGTFRVIYVTTPRPLRNYRDNIAWIAALKAVCADWQKGRAVTLGFTGEPAFVADIAGTMDWDMSTSGAITLTIIAVTFWLCYRRAQPLMLLQAMLVLTFLVTLSTAGLLLPQLTVMGVGFASIMIGLSVDYGYLVYQKSRTHTGTAGALRWECLQNVMWTAGTTAAAFFALNVSSLPGISQLGTLVGLGVIVGASVMLLIFTPLALRIRRVESKPSPIERFFASPKATRAGGWATLLIVIGFSAVLLFKGTPKLDFSANTLRPRVSGAYQALDRVYEKLTDDRDLLSLIVAGKTSEEVLARLRTAESALASARSRGEAGRTTTAAMLWPDAGHQRVNIVAVLPLAADSARLRQAVLDAGFNEEAFGLADSILKQWQQWREATVPIWPANDTSRWLLRRAAHFADGQYLALGIVQPVAGRETELAKAVEADSVFLVSWKQLGRELQSVIPAEFARVIIGLLVIVLVILWIAFRSLRDVALFLAATALTFAALAGAMSLFGMTWNLFNLAAILLLLGTGTDYSILLLLKLRRNGGDTAEAHRALGLVIFLCATSSAAGFATLGWANNVGLASLGQTCALGLAIDAVVSVFLLPPARAWLHASRKQSPPGDLV